MPEYRTSRQIEADKLDLQAHNLVHALTRFANDHMRQDVDEMALIIDGLRHRIRKYMHDKDRSATV